MIPKPHQNQAIRSAVDSYSKGKLGISISSLDCFARTQLFVLKSSNGHKAMNTFDLRSWNGGTLQSTASVIINNTEYG